MKKTFKVLVGILLLAGLGSGGYLVYHWWTKPTSEQIQQNDEQKQKIRQQIQQIRNWINECKETWEKSKKEEIIHKFSQEVLSDCPKSPDSAHSDKELKKLEEEKTSTWNELVQLTTEIDTWQKELKAKWESWWKLQKDNGWIMLTLPFAQNPEFHTRFDRIFKHFYQKAVERKGIASDPRIEFKGFKEFKVEEKGKYGEMGLTEFNEKWFGNELTEVEIFIDINRVYLLNSRKIGMDKFFPTSAEGFIIINFDSLIETIAHEIAHAIQSVKNIDNFTADPEAPDEKGKPGHIRSQCESSGLGTRDEKNPAKLIKPKYPQLVAEHTKLTEEFKQMIINSPEYKEFETWWKSA